MPVTAVRSALPPGHARLSGPKVCAQSARWYAFLRLLPTANLAHNPSPHVPTPEPLSTCPSARHQASWGSDAPVADRSPRRPSHYGTGVPLQAAAAITLTEVNPSYNPRRLPARPLRRCRRRRDRPPTHPPLGPREHGSWSVHAAAMRIFLAGASGVLGMRLVPLLVSAGHQVSGMTRSPAKAEQLAALGAVPVICDVFEAVALREAVVAARPDTVMHQLTDLPDELASIRNFAAANARIRREGTGNLLEAAHA